MSVVLTAPARKGRVPELLLLVAALGLGLLAFWLVWDGLGNDGTPPKFTLLAAGGGLFVLIVHLLIRWMVPYADPVLFPIALCLNVLGLAMIYRVDAAAETLGSRSQLILTGAGLVLFVLTVMLTRNYRVLRNYKWTSLACGIGLLLLPMLPGIGRTINGARLWIHIAGFSFQPAELAKICFAIFFASYLVAERDNLSLAGPKFLGIRLPKLRHIVPILVAWAMCMGILVFQRDFGTTLLFFGLFVAMLWVATERVSWLAIGAVLTVGGVAFVATTVPHVRARFAVWLDAFNPEIYEGRGGSYQLVQAWFGMSSGGLVGTGLGQGHPNLVYAAQSDFIFASFAEEIGLIGVMAILSLYLLFVGRGMRTAIQLRDGFGKLLASGLSFVIAIQCFIVIGGVTRLIPLTGLALPFLAQGGSALISNWIVVGLLLRLSDSSRRPAETTSQPSTEELEAIIKANGPETGTNSVASGLGWGSYSNGGQTGPRGSGYDDAQPTAPHAQGEQETAPSALGEQETVPSAQGEQETAPRGGGYLAEQRGEQSTMPRGDYPTKPAGGHQAEPWRGVVQP
ncbi:stage V sporulation protein E [Actinobaculum suis]|uniref:Stage V sporulation protein E n=1 Tax=Actinobaculum suis TaxID=1657 RepID=A0A7Z8Y7Z1_9ACTO|nr:FtsW/RodA/SpoVE family cell cycle protein [Actinobaculum suis]VDG75377.1 stage V sporulation protein E [Actinobaculum suis]